MAISIKVFLVPFISIVLSLSAQAQLVDDMSDESRLYAESKQVNQFFRRFNGEEDEKGNRYYPGDKPYRSEKVRKKYLGMLFDESNKNVAAPLKIDFVKQVLTKPETSILNFHGSDWFSEVQAIFTMNGKEEPVTLFMELEKSHLGYKWVIQKVSAPMLESYFKRDTTKVGQFLHPLSHELDFMNMRKAFANKDSVQQFTAKRFAPDHLSVFLYEIKNGNLKFKSVKEVKFHFFQIEGWYFELADFNRAGYNTGWLISDLVKLNSPSDKEVLKNYLLR